MARHSTVVGKSGLGARLRTRKVTAQGRFAACDQGCSAWIFLLSWLDEEQLGRCPKPQQGRCPCALQGTASLDPFSRLSWSRFLAPSACSFLALRLSPCLLPQLFVKNHKKSPAGSGIAPLDQPGFLIHLFSSASGISTVMINQPSCCSSVMQPPYFSAALRMLLMP